MPIYPDKRGIKNQWRVVIWARLEREGKSRSHEWTVKGKKSDAETFEAQKRVELLQQQKIELRGAPSFSSFVADHYIPYAKRQLKLSSWKTYQYVLATLVTHLGPIKLPAMSIADIERLKDARMKEGVSNRHINGDLTVLRAVLSYAESRGVILPQLKWKRLPVRSGRVHAWSRDEVERLYATAAPSFLPVLVFLLNTGCRKGEAIAAEWSWIDFDAGLIRIPVNEWWSPKSGRPREVPMSDAVRTVLSDPRKHERWVFPSAWGRRHNRFPHEAFWAARDAAGLKGGAHTTRHTFASMFLAATKGDIGKLAEILGHSHTRTTEIYAHMVPGRLAEFRNAVNLAPK